MKRNQGPSLMTSGQQISLSHHTRNYRSVCPEWESSFNSYKEEQRPVNSNKREYSQASAEITGQGRAQEMQMCCSQGMKGQARGSGRSSPPRRAQGPHRQPGPTPPGASALSHSTREEWHEHPHRRKEGGRCPCSSPPQRLTVPRVSRLPYP